MERTTRTSAWAIAAAATGVVGGAIQIGKALPPIGATANVPPTLLVLIVVSGLAAVAGGVVALRSPVAGGLLLGGAGIAALIIDTVGAAPPPRILPALIVLIAAACALGAAPAAAAPSTFGRIMVVVGIVWAALLVVAIRQRDTRPSLALAAPFVTVAIAWVVIAAGGAFLGWQA